MTEQKSDGVSGGEKKGGIGQTSEEKLTLSRMLFYMKKTLKTRVVNHVFLVIICIIQ